MIERIKHLLRKEFIQVFRDPRMRGIIFIMPVFQLIIFSYAVTTDVRHIAAAIYDLDNSVASRDLTARFMTSGYFQAAHYINSDRQAQSLLDRGKVVAVVRINKGFQSDLAARRPTQVQVLIDGTDSNTARIVLDYAVKIVGQFSREKLQSQLIRVAGAAGGFGGIELEKRAWFNENLESRNFYIPGVIALLVMLISLLLTSMAIVREKEVGTLEQLRVTPITAPEFILGKTLPFALVGLADVFLITTVGVFWFDVPVRGNLLLLALAMALYLMTTLGFGLLISTLSQTQQQAMMTTFFFNFPAVLLSGFIFPIANMPRIIQWFTYLNPLRYFMVIVRGIFLKGVGLGVLWPQMVALLILGLLTLWLATRRFEKTFALGQVH